jgi:soluble lytic murein transglycosylase-like protein
MRALLRAKLAVLVCLGAPAAAGADTLYRFVDENGVIHFSNQPNDPRYVAVRSFGTSGTLWRPRAARTPWRPRDISAYDSLIADQARSHGLPPGMVKAVIAAESNFNPKAVSRKGAQGLMQLMPATAELVGVEDPFHAEQNVRGGSRYLARLYARYGDWTRALAAYNAGPEAVDRHGGVPPYAETREYVDRVLAYYRRYDAEFDR